MKSSLDRRHEFKYRSVFDYHELYKHFLKKEILTVTHVEKLVCLSALNYPLLSDNDEENARNHTAEAWEALVPNLPRKAYTLLEQLQFRRCTLKIVELRTTESGDTDKLLLELQDGNRVETCIMRYLRNPLKGMTPEAAAAAAPLIAGTQLGERATVCVSSQVGCQMGCSFCATGTLGLSADLTSGEILEQIIIANEMEKIHRQDNGTFEKIPDGKYVRNIVYMGMGEPLDNYDEVIRSVRVLTNTRMLGFTSSKVTVSTVGSHPERIRRLIKDAPKISLALSLHAPTQPLREAIVPTAKNTTIDDLLDACFAFVNNQRALSRTSAKRQSLCVEYCLLAEVNDTSSVAHDLGKLFVPHVEYVMVNLIPYNPTDVSAGFRPPTYERVQAFAEILRQYGVRVFFRTEKGASIAGACGQLAASKKSKNIIKSREGTTPTDIEDEQAKGRTIVSHCADSNENSPDYKDCACGVPKRTNSPPKHLIALSAEASPNRVEARRNNTDSPSPFVSELRGDSDQSTMSTNSGPPYSFFVSKSKTDGLTQAQMIANSFSVIPMFRSIKSPTLIRRKAKSVQKSKCNVETGYSTATSVSSAILNSLDTNNKAAWLMKNLAEWTGNYGNHSLTWYGGLGVGIAACGALALYGGNDGVKRKRRLNRGIDLY